MNTKIIKNIELQILELTKELEKLQIDIVGNNVSLSDLHLKEISRKNVNKILISIGIVSLSIYVLSLLLYVSFLPIYVFLILLSATKLFFNFKYGTKISNQKKRKLLVDEREQNKNKVNTIEKKLEILQGIKSDIKENMLENKSEEVVSEAYYEDLTDNFVKKLVKKTKYNK